MKSQEVSEELLEEFPNEFLEQLPVGTTGCIFGETPKRPSTETEEPPPKKLVGQFPE